MFEAEGKDRNGRLLAYVYPIGEGMFNEVLLRKGYAQLYMVEPNDKYRATFASEQKKPRHRRGLARVQGQAPSRTET